MMVPEALSGMTLLSLYVIRMFSFLFSYLLLLLSVYAVKRSYFLFSYILILLSVYAVNRSYFLFSYLLVFSFCLHCELFLLSV